MNQQKISFSEMKMWAECPYKHKLKYIDNLSGFTGNEYTAFGTALHHACESLVENNHLLSAENSFTQKFEQELSELDIDIDNKLVTDMRPQGLKIIPFILPALQERFPNYEVVSIEEELMVPIPGFEKKFKGFIDLVLKTPDDKYHIIDWKTCSWGWNSRKKSDKVTNYQLILYKHFFSLKHDVDPKKIETYFALLKRTAKTNNAEIFRITSGSKKTENCITFLENALKNISNKMYIKNRLSCKYCDFYKTEHCT